MIMPDNSPIVAATSHRPPPMFTATITSQSSVALPLRNELEKTFEVVIKLNGGNLCLSAPLFRLA